MSNMMHSTWEGTEIKVNRRTAGAVLDDTRTTILIDDYSDKSVVCMIRSLVSAKDFAVYEKTSRLNLGSAVLNQMVRDLTLNGYLSAQQHACLKKRLASCELNVHLDGLPGAKRFGAFVLLQGGLVIEDWPLVT